jgi:hypothetical protein
VVALEEGGGRIKFVDPLLLKEAAAPAVPGVEDADVGGEGSDWAVGCVF